MRGQHSGRKASSRALTLAKLTDMIQSAALGESELTLTPGSLPHLSRLTEIPSVHDILTEDLPFLVM